MIWRLGDYEDEINVSGDDDDLESGSESTKSKPISERHGDTGLNEDRKLK